MRGLSRSPAIVHWLQGQLGPYAFRSTGGVVTSLDPGFSLENQTRPVSPGRVPAPDGPRARPPVVRRLGVGAPLAGRLAERGLRDYMEHRWTETHGGQSTSAWLHQTYDSQPNGFWDDVSATRDPRSTSSSAIRWSTSAGG